MKEEQNCHLAQIPQYHKNRVVQGVDSILLAGGQKRLLVGERVRTCGLQQEKEIDDVDVF